MSQPFTLTLKDGRIVSVYDYVKAKTNDLVDFGYANLKESDVMDEVMKIMRGDNNLTVIGFFCKDDIDENK